MPPKKQLKGPSLFCEWIVGTTIASALGPLPPPREKPRKRNVVRVRVTTDDEAGEDTLRITYPRSESWGKAAAGAAKIAEVKAAETKAETTAETKDETKEAAAAKAEEAKPEEKPSAAAEEPKQTEAEEAKPADEGAKKVRFEKQNAAAGPKSALKKTPADSGTEASSSGETETDTEAQSSSESEAAKEKKTSKKAKKKKKESPASVTESEDESEEPHPTCECRDCVRARGRLGKNAGDPESSKKAKKKATAKKKGEESDSETQGDTASENEEKTGKKGGKNKKSVDESDSEKKDSDKEKEDKESAAGKKKKVKTQDKSGAEPSDKEAEKPGKSSKNFKGDYPEAFPLPHPRRPNLIAPIRAEVVQTERVVETPEDPPPNAYYDQLHNIVRVYHGPVYGGHGHALYPRRNPNSRPLPVGVPHPAQNPYYHGFNNAPARPTGYENVPMPAWNAAVPALGFPPWPNQYYNKGAFDMSGAMPAPPLSFDKEKQADNNVAPDLKENPYYKGRKTSAFSNFGGSRTASDASPRRHHKTATFKKPEVDGWGTTSKQNTVSWGDNNADKTRGQNKETWGTGNDYQKASGWDTSNDQSNWNSDGNNYNNGGDTTWGASNANQGDSWGSNQNNPGDATWGSTNNNQTWGDQPNNNNDDDAWGANQNTSTWDNPTAGAETTWGETQNTGGVTWDDTDPQQNGEPGGEPAVDSNVGPASGSEKMPGSWHSEGDPQVPAWGDSTMAASTGGMINQW